MSKMRNGQHNNHEGRTPGGRFAPGNKGGPGNPFARKMAEMRRAIQNAVTAEEMAAVARVMYERALKGDVAAARLLFSYGAGRPMAGADPDTLDEHELAVRRGAVATVEDMKALVEGCPAAVMNEVAAATGPVVQAHTREAFVEGVKARVEARDRATTDGVEEEELEGTHRDPVLPWLREGLPDGVREMFEQCPAYMHPDDRPIATTVAYGKVIRQMGGDILERLRDRPECVGRGRLVSPPDGKRVKR